MAQVPDKVLSWLYSVLHEYQDPQRTYSDAARTLSSFPSLTPRTEVFTFENGSSALLLTVSGTIPVAFRGTTYRFPVKLWVPQSYPQEAPTVYIVPGREMMIRPGQHVDIDGRVYHPSLRDWGRVWDGANMTELLQFLQQAFAKEPPVISRAQQQQYQRPLNNQYAQAPARSSPVPPSVPPKRQPGGVMPVEMPSAATPPPRPPKAGEEIAGRAFSRDISRDGPPLPPLPGEVTQRPVPSSAPPQHQNGYATPPRPVSQLPEPVQSYQNGHPPGPPPLPPLPQVQQYRNKHDPSPVSPISPAISSSTRFAQPVPLQTQHYRQSSQHQQQQQQSQPQHQQTHQARQQQSWTLQQSYQPGQPTSQQYPHNVHPDQQFAVPLSGAKKQPPPDLLSDPFEVALPGSANSGPPVPAPPIPPNPEREHLLHALSLSLVQQTHQKVQQNLSALQPLQAQQTALRAAHSRLEAELAQLQSLDARLASNEAILHHSLHECDRTIETAKEKKQPPIDEVLVAPTLVAQQLWTLCAEEAACREAMYVLQKAVDRGRVGGNDFVRQMRGLGRECFLKMALARKCARGLGLEVHR